VTLDTNWISNIIRFWCTVYVYIFASKEIVFEEFLLSIGAVFGVLRETVPRFHVTWFTEDWCKATQFCNCNELCCGYIRRCYSPTTETQDMCFLFHVFMWRAHHGMQCVPKHACIICCMQVNIWRTWIYVQDCLWCMAVVVHRNCTIAVASLNCAFLLFAIHSTWQLHLFYLSFIARVTVDWGFGLCSSRLYAYSFL
jgi:hypothetical protein